MGYKDQKPDVNRGGELVTEDGDIKVEDGDFYITPVTDTNIGLYYQNAKASLEEAEDFAQRYRPAIEKLPTPFKELKEKELNDRLQIFTVPVLLHAALAVEALINYYGANRLDMTPEEFAEYEWKNRNEDGFKTPEKFETFPSMAVGVEVEKVRMQSDLKGSLKKLISKRNNLSHFKPKTVKVNEQNPDHYVELSFAKKALQTVKLACNHLVEVDSDFQFNFEEHVEKGRFLEEFEVPDLDDFGRVTSDENSG
jgi:hypothetical protein